MSLQRIAATIAGCLLVAMLLSCGGGQSPRSSSSTSENNSGSTRSPAAEVTAAQLVNDYHAALAADKDYGGKPILLLDRVVSTERTSNGAALVRVGDFDGNKIDCYFRSTNEATSLKPNSSVVVLGVCKGVNDRGVVEMTDCELVPDITIYRPIPSEFVNRFEELKPRFILKPNTNYTEMQLREYSDSVIEINGVTGFAPADGALPTITVGAFLCHFDPKFAANLKSTRMKYWPVKVRGKLLIEKGKRFELFDCGLVYRK